MAKKAMKAQRLRKVNLNYDPEVTPKIALVLVNTRSKELAGPRSTWDA